MFNRLTAVCTKEHSFVLKTYLVLLVLVAWLSVHLKILLQNSLVLHWILSLFPSPSSSPWVLNLPFEHIPSHGSTATSVLLTPSSPPSELSGRPNWKGRGHRRKSQTQQGYNMLQRPQCWRSKGNFWAHLKHKSSLLRSTSHVNLPGLGETLMCKFPKALLLLVFFPTSRSPITFCFKYKFLSKDAFSVLSCTLTTSPQSYFHQTISLLTNLVACLFQSYHRWKSA